MDPSMYRSFAELHERRHWWFVGRRRIVASVLETLLSGRRGLRILDIGCGTGGMIPVLSPFGRVTGIDPAEAAIGYSLERYGGQAEFLQVDFPRESPPGKDFDLVTLFDVLEHLDDDGEALRKAATLLSEGGRVILTVPAHRFLWSPHDEINRHRRRYAFGELRDRLLAAGLEIHRMTYFNTYLFPVVWGTRQVRRALARKGDRRSDFRIQRDWINNLLSDLFGSERHLLRHVDLPFGVSILAVAGRRAPPTAQ
jgi:SAM-dependent methyltransferase